MHAFPARFLLHLEWMAAEAHPDPAVPGAFFGAPVFLASIPLVRFVSEARLQEIIDYCAEIGVGIANPHTPSHSSARRPHHPEHRGQARPSRPNSTRRPAQPGQDAHV